MRLMLLRAAITAAGIGTLIASGGGFPDIDLTNCCSVPFAHVDPGIQTVAVGDNANFDATASNMDPPLTYQWRRNGAEIAGATQSRYTLVGANLGDDGALFSVVIGGSNGSATSPEALLQVTASPPIVFEDGDFALADWSVTVIASPASGGPSAIVTREDSGGHPDAHRAVRYDLSAGPSRVDVFHSSVAATHDPGTQGAIVGIDTRIDCVKSGLGLPAVVAIILEQAGRRFDTGLQGCGSDWITTAVRRSLRGNGFVQVDGPACGAGETCPDFSATGAPIRFGIHSAARNYAEDPAAVVTQGIDNWQVRVWRR